MPILREIKSNLSAKTLLEKMPYIKEPDKFENDTNKAMAFAEELIKSKLAYDWVPISGYKKGHIFLDSKHLNNDQGGMIWPPNLLPSPAGVESILVSIATVGPQLDHKISALNESGDYLSAYLLDQIGTLALEQIGLIVASLAEKEAHLQGWGVSPFLSPGACLGWGVEIQHSLFNLVPADQIGVQLNVKGMMYPLKSVSGIIAIGPGLTARKVPSMCSLCDRFGDCKTHKR